MDSSLHSSSRTDSSPGSITAGKVDGCTDIVARSKLVSSIVFMSREFLSETGPVREAAATCLAALLTRPDMYVRYSHSCFAKSCVTSLIHDEHLFTGMKMCLLSS